MRILRGGFQRWPRMTQTAFVRIILLLGVGLGAFGGMTAFLFTALTFTIFSVSDALIARRKQR